MPLPKITTPTYELELPSTGKTIQYRPFLVKEEKLLLFALESKKVDDKGNEREDVTQITEALKTVIGNCIKTKNIKVDELPTFDIEYLFLNIRGKSVGEEVEVNVLCPDDYQTEVKVTINLEDIKVQKNPEHTNKIKVDEHIMMEMKYPSLQQFIKNNFVLDPEDATDQSFAMIADCVDKIYTEEEVYAVNGGNGDATKQEVLDFLDQMTDIQFKQIEKFFETMPKLSHKIKVKNPKTEVESEVVLEGLSGFFG
jgi:hypothetical protein